MFNYKSNYKYNYKYNYHTQLQTNFYTKEVIYEYRLSSNSCRLWPRW